MTEIEEMQRTIRHFVEERDWTQFHNIKDMLISLNLESSEALEHVQWKTESDLLNIGKDAKFAEEMADVLYWILYIADKTDIDIVEAFYKKMKKNELKYPVEKSKGSSKKYTELQ